MDGFATACIIWSRLNLAYLLEVEIEVTHRPHFPNVVALLENPNTITVLGKFHHIVFRCGVFFFSTEALGKPNSFTFSSCTTSHTSYYISSISYLPLLILPTTCQYHLENSTHYSWRISFLHIIKFSSGSYRIFILLDYFFTVESLSIIPQCMYYT